jgi:hypothetical protein
MSKHVTRLLRAPVTRVQVQPRGGGPPSHPSARAVLALMAPRGFGVPEPRLGPDGCVRVRGCRPLTASPKNMRCAPHRTALPRETLAWQRGVGFCRLSFLPVALPVLYSPLGCFLEGRFVLRRVLSPPPCYLLFWL